MTFILGLFFFILGLIIGSFLNVVIFRYNTGKSIQGRSGCLSCGKKLEAWELIPLISFVLLRGKCSQCKSRISFQYPLVEFATGFLFLITALRFSGLIFVDFNIFIYLFILFAAIFSILIVIFVYDIKHKIIPDSLVFSFAVLALIYRFTETGFSNLDLLSWLDIFSGVIFFLPFFVLWLISQGRWIGLGDGKLALGIGWMLGFVHGISALVLSFWIGAIVSVMLMLIARLIGPSEHITMKSEIPFAPFMILGAIIIFFYPVDLLNVSLFFFK